MAAAMIRLVLLLALVTFCSASGRVLLADQTQATASISVSEDHYKLHQTLHAKGYQYYRYNGTSWVQFNATARLWNTETNKIVGHHFFLPQVDANGGQPTWESSSSTFSSVTCKVVSKVASDSIPWLLLEATQSHGSAKYFGDVKLVQRVNTKGGLAPRSTKGARVGQIKKSPYLSDYLFYVSRH